MIKVKKIIKNSMLLSAVSLPLLVQGKLPEPQLNSGVTMSQLTHRQPIHWVSIAQIARSLQNQPVMNVGFDIDDTVLFSSPGFYRGKQEFSPNSMAYLHNPKFWQKVNNGWDKFSIPKQSAIKLMSMHLKRGDHIYFITGRPKTKTETVTAILQHDFNIPKAKMHAVIFAGPKHGAKAPYIKKLNIKLYYGDSDGDITDARRAGAEGIRVLRPLNSTNKPMPYNGRFGEKVIVNSDY
ncbi:acid phosphatase AphA [Piscirickettsia salmonis]|uniref:acid phosphatase AphA n=1 Tax=Piscirickettsia salmonis TaxID=1238 RepID=UPI0002F9D90A|nr:acid phosphatase AphA [Piscirickettsia salmonis]QGN76321.1 Class B acid phosphatase precursor [Piscirickettsia salmonis]QGN79882.1 Class B acid phosphatase precursor [Piscirickettsia salmonis]QGN83472.1 Class B acid phosphatase precursor [Piscirickettsia salmonis]QGN86985.1 Class B acid phosphatase precursor [Piscirickettsia salmonis]QGN90488.1 Class B acid phosphatase precursor [Piscirickettsia salmonis]